MPAGRPARYSSVVGNIRSWAAAVDRTFLDSARAHGGPDQRPRWVLTPSCTVDVARVRLSARGADSFRNTIDELAAKGFDRPNRKYLVWMDANVLCGIATMYHDTNPGQDNANNGRAPSYGRVDSGCWGLANSIEAHELVHMLGGVQRSAPNGTPNGHCTEGHDLMCYPDAAGTKVRTVCGREWARLLDCGGNDYYNPGRPSGWLSRSWNVASSAFLVSTQPTAPPPSRGNASFADVSPSAYYAEAVDWLHAERYTTGCAADRFCPQDSITRGQMATFLWRMHGSPRVQASRFADVPRNAYYAEAVDWLHAKRYTTGCAADRFCPQDSLTRGQMATFLWRMNGSPRVQASRFADVPRNAYYAEAVDWLHAKRYTTGCAADRFCPQDSLTRGQMATFLWRMNA